MRNSASVTYKLFAVTPWKGVPAAASATSATAGAAARKYIAKLVANVELAAATACEESCCVSLRLRARLLRVVGRCELAAHMWVTLLEQEVWPAALYMPYAKRCGAASICMVIFTRYAHN